MNELAESTKPFEEWTYLEDSLGIVYCLGRAHSEDQQDAVSTYYRTSPMNATKQTMDSDRFYRRLIYQGLPEEHERLLNVESQEIVEKLVGYTEMGAGIVLDPGHLISRDDAYRDASQWLNLDHPNASAFQSTLEVACMALESAGITNNMTRLYGAASFGLVSTTARRVEDIDIVLSIEDLPAIKDAVAELQSGFRWSEIDPHNRLPENRQRQKAKRWSTSQIRLVSPYEISIDLKAAREPGAYSLWANLPETKVDEENTSLELKVIDDSEAFCTSPSIICEDRAGNVRVLLLEGYQYIGCAVVGDVIEVTGRTYHDSSIVHVTQAMSHHLLPDFRNVPLLDSEY